MIRADTPAEVFATVARVRAIATRAGADPGQAHSDRGFVPGPEVAVEAMLTGGELSVLAIFDKPDPLDGPYFEETIYVTPSRLRARPTFATVSGPRPRPPTDAPFGLSEGPGSRGAAREGNGRAFVIEVRCPLDWRALFSDARIRDRLEPRVPDPRACSWPRCRPAAPRGGRGRGPHAPNPHRRHPHRGDRSR